MNTNSIHVKRTTTTLKPDQSRVLLRSFSFGYPALDGRIIARIMSLPENRVGPLLDEVSAELRSLGCHPDFFAGPVTNVAGVTSTSNVT
jgi:hypothetical protein